MKKKIKIVLLIILILSSVYWIYNFKKPLEVDVKFQATDINIEQNRHVADVRIKYTVHRKILTHDEGKGTIWIDNEAYQLSSPEELSGSDNLIRMSVYRESEGLKYDSSTFSSLHTEPNYKFKYVRIKRKDSDLIGRATNWRDIEEVFEVLDEFVTIKMKKKTLKQISIGIITLFLFIHYLIFKYYKKKFASLS